jgi:threonine synthase
LWDAGYFRDVPEADREVVCILTGHGLKDPNTALHAIEEPVPIQPSLDAVLAAIGI